MPKLNKNEIKRIQCIISTFLFYGRAIDPTIMVALSSIASQQSNATVTTALAADKETTELPRNPS